MLKIFISEDETRTLNAIKKVVENYCKDVVLVGYSETVRETVNYLKNNSTDLLLTDIKFPDGTAFDILRQLPSYDFKIIFITAYEKYAIDAIKLSASDYLLKPLNPKELISAVYEVNNNLKLENSAKISLETLLVNNLTKEHKKRKIVLKTHEYIRVVEISDIVRCESDSSYTFFFFQDNSRILVSKNLKEFDEILCDYGFFRIHKSHLINIDYIENFERNSGFLVMKDKSRVPVAVRKKEALMQILNNL